MLQTLVFTSAHICSRKTTMTTMMVSANTTWVYSHIYTHAS